MKEKTINILIFVLTLFIVGYGKVNAEGMPVTPAEVPSDTYIIGTHAFTTDRTYLSTEDIMWAARSIPGNTREDMVIYYKDYNDNWKNGVTGTQITTPSIFEIEEIDGRDDPVFEIASVYNETDDVFLNTQEYSELWFNVTNDANRTYTTTFNAYNIDDGTYTGGISCAKIGEDFMMGDIANITILDHQFDMEFPFTTGDDLGDYTCDLDIGEYETNFNFTIGEPEPSVIPSWFFIDDNSMQMGLGEIRPIDNTYYLRLSNDYEYMTGSLDFYFETKFINSGNHSIDVSVKKDGQQYTIIDKPTNINVSNSMGNNKYGIDLILNFGEELNVGEYEIEFTIDNDITNTFYLIVQEPTEITFENLKIGNNVYDSAEQILTSDGNKIYTFNFTTENIPNGTYNISRSEIFLDESTLRELTLSDYVDQPFNRDQRVTVTDNKFSYNITIPKNTEPGKYSFYINLATLDDIPVGFGNSCFHIWSTKTSAIKFSTSDDSVDNYITQRDSLGRGILGLVINAKVLPNEELYDGFEIYVAPENVNENYILLEDLETSGRLVNGVYTASTTTHVPVGTPKYYKVKPYVLDGETKVYKEESDPIYILSNLNLPYFHFEIDPISQNYVISYDDYGNATLNLQIIPNPNNLTNGFEIEYTTDPFGEWSILDEVEYDDGQEFVTIHEKEVTINTGATGYYRVREYINSDAGKIYSQYSDTIRYENSNS